MNPDQIKKGWVLQFQHIELEIIIQLTLTTTTSLETNNFATTSTLELVIQTTTTSSQTLNFSTSTTLHAGVLPSFPRTIQICPRLCQLCHYNDSY
ncbi:unnamed protein product [Ambrosiozyma monospora]|uniref:Unnamed protein product n=1 Tax=Ambrosiozyma monospora TaxID=43982 RepID=A0A9W7DJF5_AMBMO|nr:unnamed protein product [Ambrosiozyma monospora]